MVDVGVHGLVGYLVLLIDHLGQDDISADQLVGAGVGQQVVGQVGDGVLQRFQLAGAGGGEGVGVGAVVVAGPVEVAAHAPGIKVADGAVRELERTHQV